MQPKKQTNDKKLFTHEYDGIPKIRSQVLLTSNAKSVTVKMLVFWLSGRLQEVVANKGYCRGTAC